MKTFNEKREYLKSIKKLKESKKLFGIISIIIFITFFILIFIFIGKPMIQFVSKPENFREWVEGHGFIGKLTFVGMMVLQVIVAIIPGEPLEIGAGYAFGTIEGTILCLIGAAIGGTVIYYFVKYVGIRVIEIFFPRKEINSLKFLRDTKKLNIWIFILFFIPGTPKDIITYFIGITPVKLSKYLIISSIARIPSVITSTIAGNALGTQDYKIAVIVFIVTAGISAVGMLTYKLFIEKDKNSRV